MCRVEEDLQVFFLLFHSSFLGTFGRLLRRAQLGKQRTVKITSSSRGALEVTCCRTTKQECRMATGSQKLIGNTTEYYTHPVNHRLVVLRCGGITVVLHRGGETRRYCSAHSRSSQCERRHSTHETCDSTNHFTADSMQLYSNDRLVRQLWGEASTVFLSATKNDLLR